MTELARRCEEAEGPSRELDCLIGVAIGKFFTQPNKGWPDRLDYCRHNDDGSTTYPGNGFDQMVPYYTSSLDAAMTLVPEGWQRSCGNCDADDHPWACLTSNVEPYPDYAANGVTEALALCAAALRAGGKS